MNFGSLFVWAQTKSRSIKMQAGTQQSIEHIVVDAMVLQIAGF